MPDTAEAYKNKTNTANAWVTAVAQVLSLAWELPHAVGTAKTKQNNDN